MIPYLYVFNAIIMIISRKCVTLCSAGEYDLGLVVGIMPLAKKLSIYLEMGRYHDDRYRYFVLSIADTRYHNDRYPIPDTFFYLIVYLL